MTEREKILGRIREALAVASPLPGHTDPGASSILSKPGAIRSSPREWLPPVGATRAEQLEQFRANATELRADFQVLESLRDLPLVIGRLAQTEGWQRGASHGGSLAEAACAGLRIPILRVDQRFEIGELESCDVGITECDALVAQTGSVLVTSRSAGGRALSVLPPHHLVVARREQMVPDLPAAFELLRRIYDDHYPSFISLITGPSRTGDIERILVLGAHGPKKLTIVCV